MVRIRRTNYLDIFKIKNLDSYLESGTFFNAPFSTLLNILPLKYRFLPESYALEHHNNIAGAICTTPSIGNHQKWIINQLLLNKNDLEAGKELVNFIISRYGAKGATSFVTKIDSSFDDILRLFIDGCGFRQCSSEQLWSFEEIRFSNRGNTFFRPFKNSDAQAVAMIFNDSVMTHFKHSISKTKDEYKDTFCSGLNNDYSLNFVVEDKQFKTVSAHFSITTSDNLNYVLNISKSIWYECEWEDILQFSVDQISKRTKKFKLHVRIKKYTINAEHFEKYLAEKGAKQTKNEIVLVKDFYRVIKENEYFNAKNIIMFNEANNKPVF